MWLSCLIFVKLTGQSQTSPDVSVQRVCVHPVQRRLWRWWDEPSSASDWRSQSWSSGPNGGTQSSQHTPEHTWSWTHQGVGLRVSGISAPRPIFLGRKNAFPISIHKGFLLCFLKLCWQRYNGYNDTVTTWNKRFHPIMCVTLGIYRWCSVERKLSAFWQ